MSNIDKHALRNLALRATQGPWSMEHENIWYYENGYTKHLAYFCQGDDVDDHQDDANTRYVAAADPTTVLALLDELEAKDKRIDELEARENVLIIKHPVIGRAYSALNRVWTEQEVRKACELAGIKLNIAAAGKGECVR